MPHQFVARNGLVSLDNVTITGSLEVTQGITGSIKGNATSASYVPLIAGPNVTIRYGVAGIEITSSAGSSGTPGGSQNQLQYNNGVGFGGIPTAIYNGTTLSLTGSFSGSLIGDLVGSASYASTASNVPLIAGPNITINYKSAGIEITSSAGSGGTPGGTQNQIQYNTGVTFGGVPSLVYDGTNLRGTGSFSGSFVGQFSGTSSWSSNSVSSSYSTTSSYSVNSSTASYVATSSWANNALTASYIATASWSNNSTTASYVATSSWSNNSTTASYIATASYVATSSWSNNSITASYIATASYVATSSWANNVVTSSYSTTASYYSETDPVFVSKSGSLATTGSNFFNGNQTITGSLTVTGNVSGSFTGSLLGTSSFANVASTVLTVPGLTGTTNYISIFNTATSVSSSAIYQSGSNLGLWTTTPFNGATDPQNTVTINGNSANITLGDYAVLGKVTSNGYGAVGSNYYLDGSGNLRRKNPDSFSAIEFSAGAFIFLSDASSTANSTITKTELAKLDASGRFTLGTTVNTGERLQVSGSSRLSGSVLIVGNTTITGSLAVTSGITGSLLGTSSYADFSLSSSIAALNIITASATLSTITFTKGNGSTFDVAIVQSGTVATASYVATASWSNNAISSSYSLTASYVSLANTASYVATSSWSNNAVTASYVATASWSNNSISASYYGGSVTSASYASTSSWSLNSITSSYASTASYVVNAISSSYASSSLSSSYSTSSSYAINAATASYVLNAISSSYSTTSSYSNSSLSSSYSTTTLNVLGGTSGYLALWTSNTTLASSSVYQNAGNLGIGVNPIYKLDVSGSVRILGGLIVNGSTIADSLTGSLQGTASWSNNALTASYYAGVPATSSWATNAVTASYVTASNVFGPNGSNSVLSSSYSITASYIPGYVSNNSTGSFVTNSQTASFVTNSQTSSFVTNNQTGSFVTNNQTGSFVVNSQTSSFVSNNQTGSFITNSQTSSFVTNSQTSSFVTNSQTSSFVTNGQTSSFVTNAQTSSATVLSSSFASTSSFAPLYVLTSVTASMLSAYTLNSATSSGTVLSSSYAQTSSLTFRVSGSMTGSLQGTASWSQNAITASYYAGVPATSSWANNAVTSSYYAETDPIFVSKSGSFATTGSNTFAGSQIVNGSVRVISGLQTTGSLSAQLSSGTKPYVLAYDITTGNITYQSTSSFGAGGGGTAAGGNGDEVQYNNGGILGGIPTLLYNTGAGLRGTGSFNGTFSGTLTGTASWASNAITSSRASTASYYAETDPIFVAKSASFASTGSNTFSGNQTVTGWVSASQGFSGSLSGTASWSNNAQTASYVATASWSQNAVTASYYGGVPATSSWATNAITASYVTSSNIYGPNGSNSILSSSYAMSSSWSINSSTASYIATASWSNNAVTASYIATASWSRNSTSASYYLETDPIFVAKSGSLATTGSNTFKGNQIISGSVILPQLTSQINKYVVSYDTASGQLYYQVTSSGGGSSPTPGGSPSQIQYNNAGALDGVPTLVYVGGLLSATGSFTGSFTGQLLGTSSWSNNSTTASYIATASYVATSSWSNNSQTASYIATASWSSNSVTASYIATASWANRAVTSSYIATASYVATSSWSNNAITASYFYDTLQNVTTNGNSTTNNVIISGSLLISGSNQTQLRIGSTNLVVNNLGNTGLGTLGSSTYKLEVTGSSDYVASFSKLNNYPFIIYTDLTGVGMSNSNPVQATGTQLYYQSQNLGHYWYNGSNLHMRLTASGSLIVSSVTGSLQGTSSWSQNSVSSSYATTSSLSLRNLLTASVSSNVITFTKGDLSTFSLTVDTGSGGGGSLSGGVNKYLPVWTGASSQSTSSIYQYSSTQVNITGSSLAVGNIVPSAIVGRIDASNDIVAYSTSDKRFKTNITPISNAIEKIKEINGVEFDWIEHPTYHGNKGHDVGVIAQELENVLPEVVTTRDNGYKAVKYDKIVSLLIEAIKDQQKQIEDLQDKINKLT